MAAGKITGRDHVIWELLKDPNWRVMSDGDIQTRCHKNGGRAIRDWRPAGRISASRNGSKLYRRVKYKGVELYAHRIVWAAIHGHIDSSMVIDHKDMNGLNNEPENLQMITASVNLKQAYAVLRRMGMSAAEARENWRSGNNWGHGWMGVS